jgi:serine/threonine protein kinase
MTICTAAPADIVEQSTRIGNQTKNELKDDWRDFKSPSTRSIEMEEDTGAKVVAEENPVLITLSQANENEMGAIQEEIDEGGTGCLAEGERQFTGGADETKARDGEGADGGDVERKQYVSPKDFELLKVIGMGAFGKVVQVRNKKSNKILAMKVISKRLLRRKTAYVKQMQLERDVLKKISHPFIVTMHCSFQAKEKLFIVMDFLAGGELFERLGKEGIFLESQACFYLGEIILALEHLHNHNVLHRDLKPENILLGSDGHVCLTDFGLAKDFSVEQGYWSEAPETNADNNADREKGAQDVPTGSNGDEAEQEPIHRARTICGTTEYMAPEMIARKGYGKPADFWSLGCVAYEMLSGNTPFTSRKGDKDLMRKILCERIKMPTLITADAVKILKGLLNRNPQDRLGSAKGNMFNIGGVAGLKQMPFFKPLNWVKLEKKEIEPPAKFAVDSECDTQHFHEEFVSMTVPRSITEMASDEFQPRRCESDQFRGFSFIQSDFDLPERNGDEWDSYWNSTADPDCDSASECASGVFSDKDDETPVVTEKKPKKKKKKKAAAAPKMEDARIESAPAAPQEIGAESREPHAHGKVDAHAGVPPAVPPILPTNLPTQDAASKASEKKKEANSATSAPAKPKESPWVSAGGKPRNGKSRPSIPHVSPTNSLSSCSSLSAKLSNAEIHPSTPQTEASRLISSVLSPSSGSYVPPHLRMETAVSAGAASPGLASFRKGPSYLVSPSTAKRYVGSNVALNGAIVTVSGSEPTLPSYKPAPGSWAAKMAGSSNTSGAAPSLKPRAPPQSQRAAPQSLKATATPWQQAPGNARPSAYNQMKQTPPPAAASPNNLPSWPSLGGQSVKSTTTNGTAPRGAWG